MRKASTSDVSEGELLKERAEGACRDIQQRVRHGDLDIVTAADRIPGTGQTGSGQIAEHIGVVRLPVTVVSFADHDRRCSVKSAASQAAMTAIEIPRILMKQRRKQGRAEEGGPQPVAIDGRITLCIARESGP